MAKDEKLYIVKWPKAEGYRIRSMSGVLVESNVQRQIVLHFYNEVRELEEEVQYREDGQRDGDPRAVTYVRELSDSLLISEETAMNLRHVLNSLFPAPDPEEMN
ncbi:MAG: hypothetical protein IIA14_03630 [SAR324 cluster bacterium]|nr:hypothetical protein [SAR324 cluster bacterium]